MTLHAIFDVLYLLFKGMSIKVSANMFLSSILIVRSMVPQAI